MSAPPDWKVIVREGFEFSKRLLWGRPLYRFFTTVLVLGVSLIAGPGIWAVLVELSIGVVWPDEGNATFVAQLIGVGLCLLAILLFVMFHLRDQAEERRQAQRDAEEAFKTKAAALIGAIGHLVKRFEDPALAKPPGYLSDDIRQARELAREVHAAAPKALRQNGLLTSLMNAGIDASGQQPVFGLPVESLSRLKIDLEQYTKEGGDEAQQRPDWAGGRVPEKSG